MCVPTLRTAGLGDLWIGGLGRGGAEEQMGVCQLTQPARGEMYSWIDQKSFLPFGCFWLSSVWAEETRLQTESTCFGASLFGTSQPEVTTAWSQSVNSPVCLKILIVVPERLKPSNDRDDTCFFLSLSKNQEEKMSWRRERERKKGRGEPRQKKDRKKERRQSLFERKLALKKRLTENKYRICSIKRREGAGEDLLCVINAKEEGLRGLRKNLTWMVSR